MIVSYDKVQFFDAPPVFVGLLGKCSYERDFFLNESKKGVKLAVDLAVKMGKLGIKLGVHVSKLGVYRCKFGIDTLVQSRQPGPPQSDKDGEHGAEYCPSKLVYEEEKRIN